MQSLPGIDIGLFDFDGIVQPTALILVFDQALENAYQAEPSVTLLCCQYIRNTLSSLRATHIQRTSADEIVACVSALKSAVDVLHQSYSSYMYVIQDPVWALESGLVGGMLGAYTGLVQVQLHSGAACA